MKAEHGIRLSLSPLDQLAGNANAPIESTVPLDPLLFRSGARITKSATIEELVSFQDRLQADRCDRV